MISFVVAMDRNRLIGKDNQLPWHLPADLKYFKKVTMGHPIVMGRKTYESIGKPLPGRKNIILTRNEAFSAEGCEVIHSPRQIPHDGEEIFVIGGAELFRALMTEADRLYITEIEETFEGDTYFPEIDSAQWQVIERVEGVVDEQNRYPHVFLVYERVNR